MTDAEPETSVPTLALGGLDVVLGDEYPFHPRPPDDRLHRESLLEERFRILLPADHPQAAHGGPVPLASLSGRRVGGGQGAGVLLGADDPRVPRARRVRARHPPPLQRPADAARARGQRPVR